MRSYRKWMALVLAVSPALWLFPLEQRIQAERQEMRYGGAPMSLALRDRIGQGMAIGLLAGFRGVVADFLWILNETYWEKLWMPQTDKRALFVRMYSTMTTTTLLQPQAALFWEHSAWHMAWNIGYAARIDPANRTEAEGRKRDWEWREKARQLLEDGIQNNPRDYRLYFYLGYLYLHKLQPDDPEQAQEAACRAADYFRQAAEFEAAPSYAARECAHALEVCGKPQAAYDYWKNIWNHGNVRRFHDSIDMRSIAQREMSRLENKLQIPIAERVFPPRTPSTRSPVPE